MPAGVRLFMAGQYSRRYGEPEIRQLQVLVKHGTVAVDVGASGGSYAYNLARLVGSRGQVICVEPIPDQANKLRNAARQLRLPVQVEACALSDHTGQETLHVPVDNGQSLLGWASLEPHCFDRFETINVSVRTLDELTADVASPVSFIKIDVEGHELAVLRGAAATIAKHRPVMLVEIEDRHSPTSLAERFAFIENLGYKGSFLDGHGTRRDLEDFDPSVHQRGAPAADERSDTYVNNFLFLPT